MITFAIMIAAAASAPACHAPFEDAFPCPAPASCTDHECVYTSCGTYGVIGRMHTRSYCDCIATGTNPIECAELDLRRRLHTWEWMAELIREHCGCGER